MRKTHRTRRLVEELVGPMERAGRVVSPTCADWVEASRIISTIEGKERGWRSKLPALLNDVLIALCARQIGATVLTYNRQDFQHEEGWKNKPIWGDNLSKQ